jgi:photosystem I subunit PsaN
VKAQAAPKRAQKQHMIVDAKRAAALFAAAAVSVSLNVAPARADLTSDLLAKTEANKELNDKKRAATSSANFERSRLVTDGFCNFPDNIFGCVNAATRGDVKFLSDDLKVECEGTEAGKICASKQSGSFLGL